MRNHPIRTFSVHYREKYGYGVGKIPLDLGLPCPNREKGGCIYCAPSGFTPGYLSSDDDILTQVKRGKKQLLQGRFTKYFAYFQQETSTAYPSDKFLTITQSLLSDDDCIGLIISTRPDYVIEPFFRGLKKQLLKYDKECLVELGLQSSHERSLKLINRNHTLQDFESSLDLLRTIGGFGVSAHLILGLPGEEKADMVATIKKMVDLGLDGLKLHHLQVVKDTVLQEMYKKGNIKLFSQQEYFDLLLEILPLIPENVVIHRLWSATHPDLLVAPKWNVLATELSRKLIQLMEKRRLFQGCNVVKI